MPGFLCLAHTTPFMPTLSENDDRSLKLGEENNMLASLPLF
jgi:hypothetical protein